ncbi:MAG: cell wall-binding repeat-containing protein, partial [Clostridia bacterium]|nr:cell wall-binding repeat-containing protein [Clostridia bacterium]
KEDVLIKAIYEESGAVTTTGTNKMTGSGAEELGIAGLYMKYFSNNPSSVQVHVYRRLRISELADALEMYYTGLYEHLSEYNITRLAGASRVDTAIEICKSGWSRTGTVILANGYSFADAMAGVPLSYALDAPILLTANDSSGLEANVKTAIVNTRAKNIIILGGTQAVSQSIENQLKKASYNVERVAGSSRYETSTAIAQKLYQVKGSYGDTVFVASGSNYPDALAVSPVAAMLGDPIIYARPDATVDASAAQYFADSAAKKVVILGGSGAVGSAAEDNIRTLGVTDVQRVYGASRYDTAMTIVNKYKSLFTTSDIAFATGVSFPDALAGGAFAAKKGMPVILIAEKTAPSGLSAYISSKNTENIYVFGGYGALSDFAIGNALN